MEFVCPRCNYSTSHKHHFINHINRKKDCPSTISEVCLESLREQYTKPISIYTCEHCSKSFKHQPNMSRHKKTCKRSTTSEKKTFRRSYRKIDRNVEDNARRHYKHQKYECSYA